MKKIKNIYSLQLLFFAIFISILFVYLYKIANNIKNYNSYKNDISSMMVLNLKLNNFLEKNDQFINFDLIVEKTNNFEERLDILLRSKIGEEFGEEFIPLIKAIRKDYKKKIDLIERFKSRQASNLNSLHYVYDLNHYFSSRNIISENLKLKMNNTLFMIMQHFINLNKKRDEILANLKDIKEINQTIDLKKINLLYIHSKKIIDNIDYLEITKRKSLGLDLNKKLLVLHSLLIKKYNEKLFYQSIIVSFFFLSILFGLYLIYKEQRKTIKIKNELSAFRFAVENSDNSVVITDPDRNILYVNDIFEKNTGFNKNDIKGQKPKLLSSGETPESTYVDLDKKLNAGQKWEGEFVNRRKDGTIFYEKASIVPIIVDDELINYLAIKLDITKYIEQNEKLKLSSAAFDNIQEGILICDKDKKIIILNDALSSLTGYSKEELLGNRPNIFKSGQHDRMFYKKMWLDIKENGRWKGKVYDKTKDGEIIPFWLNIIALKNKRGEVSKYIAVHTSLKEIIDTQKKAEFLAYHDSLTSLPNRVKLEEDLNYLIKLAKRNALNLFVLFIDLDRFKIINDTLGHNIGDELLKIVSSRIKKNLRQSDILARMGGDEFIVVLDSIRDKKSAGYVCEKILKVIKEPIVIENNTLNTSASIGIAMYPNDGENYETLIKNADTAMYHAKDLGKNNFQYYDAQLSLDVHEQLKIEQALKEVVKRNELFLNYQPQYDLNEKNIHGFEALVRWIHPEFGYVPPDKFIPIAEDTGSIIEIGKFIFETACRDFVKFKELNKELKYIAINISSIQFKDSEFVSDLIAIINKYNLKANEVELEVTERYIMEFSQSNMNTINSLKELGFRFSIDDFGTGYSSLSYLTKLPINVIKVDKAFIDRTPHDNNNVQIAKAIVALAKSLDYSVVAEGIEDIEQEEFLKNLKCDMGQGYLFSKPLDFDGIIKFLKR